MTRLEMTVAGRVLRLRWDVPAWLEIEDKGHSLDALTDEMFGERPTRARLTFAAALINSGARQRGENADMTEKWLEENLTTSQLKALNGMCNLAYLLGNRRENAADEDGEEEVDAVLEELQKKREAEAEKEA